MAPLEIIEYTDPGCSWAWGSEPKLRLLRWRHGHRLRWRRVLGGLVGDMLAYDPDFDAEQRAPDYAAYWATVSEHTGMPAPDPLHWMYASTEPACLAVTAAARQGEEVADRVLRRLREATFVHGHPPDDPDRIAAALTAVPGLDRDRLLADLDDDEVGEAFQRDWEATRRPDPEVLELEEEGPGAGNAKHAEGHWRYVFPTIVVRNADERRIVPGWKPYEAYVAAFEELDPGVTADPRPDPTPAEVLEAFGTATGTELEFLCGPGAEPPADAVALDVPGGVLWCSPAEARARGLEGGL
jgi:protein-disulfide isomerase-like protein with CxxC motif